MKITIFRNGKSWKTFDADEIAITTITLGSDEESALFLVSQSGDLGITIDAEAEMNASFGENQITLTQPVS